MCKQIYGKSRSWTAGAPIAPSGIPFWRPLGRRTCCPSGWLTWISRRQSVCGMRLHQAVEQGAFGYYRVPDAYYESILGWEKTRTRYMLRSGEWIRTTSGVVSGLFQLIQAITAPGDGILVQIPVYYPFYRVIRNTGRRAVYHPLTERNGIYTVDLEQFEQTIVAQRPKLFLLCSPHNPVGRVWREEELRGMLACCPASSGPGGVR